VLLLTVQIIAGVIDQDYRGNIGVVLFNFGKEDFTGMLPFSDVIKAFWGRGRSDEVRPSQWKLGMRRDRGRGCHPEARQMEIEARPMQRQSPEAKERQTETEAWETETQGKQNVVPIRHNQTWLLWHWIISWNWHKAHFKVTSVQWTLGRFYHYASVTRVLHSSTP